MMIRSYTLPNTSLLNVSNSSTSFINSLLFFTLAEVRKHIVGYDVLVSLFRATNAYPKSQKVFIASHFLTDALQSIVPSVDIFNGMTYLKLVPLTRRILPSFYSKSSCSTINDVLSILSLFMALATFLPIIFIYVTGLNSIAFI